MTLTTTARRLDETPGQSATPDAFGASPILVPGRNCWRIEPAQRVAVLIDGADYFRHLEQALRQARHSILVVGWDFDGRIKLCPDVEHCPPLGDFLRSLVEATPTLHVNILIWSVAPLHAAGAPAPLLIGAPWQDHPRITLRLDREHPFYGSHHQKIVCVDGSLAFVGGIDLTVERWDTCGHVEGDPNRRHPQGARYRPVHDVQAVVDGAAAQALDEIARLRWCRATRERLPNVAQRSAIWPDGLASEFTNNPVAISRTYPAWRDGPQVEEIAALTVDALAAGRQLIYIEAQYFTARNVRKTLERSLQARRGPEIVVVATRSTHGVLERMVMTENRERLVRRLRQLDRHNRLRVFYAAVAGRQEPCDVLIHSKLMIVDDRLLRIGSANLNNRSMGLDTECDLAIEAADAAAQRAIRRVRARLVGEHLGVDPAMVETALAKHGSLIRAIDALNRLPRGLRPFPETDVDGPTGARLGTWLLDPRRPFEPLWWRKRRRALTS
jgi:phosphatidylserine/phosphatidylglycerophosphate/cardiolipin synthase-like enzyme